MSQVVPLVLWSWVPITLVLFSKLPPRRAAIACVLGGWLLLPTARYADSVAFEKFAYWIMPACVVSDVWVTKARIIGVACLLGVAAFDPGCWRRFQPSKWDIPILGWCLCPLISGFWNDIFIFESMADAAYMALAWGVPYLVGRVYFADSGGLDELARGVVIAGLACVPACILEFAFGPCLYATFYGFHPYQTPGMTRYVGFRPILFFEDGNQLGTWLATAALVAAWSWRSGRLRGFGQLPGGLVVLLLIGQSLLAQSVGAILLLLACLACLELIHRVNRLWLLAVPAVLAIGFLGVRATNLIDAKALAMSTGPGREIVKRLTGNDRGSIGWRLRVEERAARLALKRPILGWSRWDWWRGAGMRPWGLPGLALGQYGLVGWGVLMTVFAVPPARFFRLAPPSTWTSPGRASAAALAAAWVLNVADSVFNAALILPMLMAAGGVLGVAESAVRSNRWFNVAPSAAGRQRSS